ncbi:MAG: GTPase HflX, partial [bacterium]|nr:GTPase HflX [bacterium]
TIQVFNKIDLQEGWIPKIDYNEGSCKVWISAAKNLGLDLLKEAIAAQLHGVVLIEDIILKAKDAKLRAQLYQLGAVLSESIGESGDWLLQIRLTASQKERLFLKAV